MIAFIARVGLGGDVTRAGVRQRDLIGHGSVRFAIPRRVGQGEFRDDDLIGHGVGGGVVVHAGDAPDVRDALLPLLPGYGVQPVQITGRAEGHGAELCVRQAYVIVAIAQVIFEIVHAENRLGLEREALEPVLGAPAHGFCLRVENGSPIDRAVRPCLHNHLHVINVAGGQRNGPALGFGDLPDGVVFIRLIDCILDRRDVHEYIKEFYGAFAGDAFLGLAQRDKAAGWRFSCITAMLGFVGVVHIISVQYAARLDTLVVVTQRVLHREIPHRLEFIPSPFEGDTALLAGTVIKRIAGAREEQRLVRFVGIAAQ